MLHERHDNSQTTGNQTVCSITCYDDKENIKALYYLAWCEGINQ